jgi:hypothetical protein
VEDLAGRRDRRRNVQIEGGPDMLLLRLRRVRKRLSYSNVMSTLAVFLVLSAGGAYAHGLIGTNDITKAAVTTPKLAGKAVKSKKIAPQAVKKGKLADGAVTPSKLSSFVVRTEDLAVASGAQAGGGSECDPGELLIGGGAHWPAFGDETLIIHSLPQPDENRWFARGVNNEANERTLRVVAYCLQP